MFRDLQKWLDRNPHAWWVLALPYLIVAYILPEILIVDSYTSTAIPADGYIPFLPQAVVFYGAWYPMMFLTGIWLLLRDGHEFKRYMLALSVGMTVSGLIYVLWPNGQDLRPDLSVPGNVFELVLKKLYEIDTNTNVLPSLHVSCSVVAVFAVWQTHSIRYTKTRVAITILAVLVSVSTVFVKQHAVLDVITGAPLGAIAALAGRTLFRRKERGEKRGAWE